VSKDKENAWQRLLSGGELTEAGALALSRDPLEEAFARCSQNGNASSAFQRAAHFKPVVESLRSDGWQLAPEQVWARYLPLTEMVLSWRNPGHPTLVGLAGPPGGGKSSLARILKLISETISRGSLAVVSLDDFYLTPTERSVQGFRWRAVPGTHDLKLLRKFLIDLKDGCETLALPRYDTSVEVRLDPEKVAAPGVLLFEGWFVGARAPGYEPLADAVERLIYLDIDLEVAHQSRLAREAKIRSASNHTEGLTVEDTELFWHEALYPGCLRWVLPLRDQANVSIAINERHEIIGAACRTL
jgi:pantothenate kinase-related protein Tda10